MSITKWLEAQRAAEAAMTPGPWETYRPWPEMTYERIGTREDHGVMPLRSVNAHGDIDVGNVRGIVRARNHWALVLDVVEAAMARHHAERDYREHPSEGNNQRVYATCDAVDDALAALEAKS